MSKDCIILVIHGKWHNPSSEMQVIKQNDDPSNLNWCENKFLNFKMHSSIYIPGSFSICLNN